MNEYSKFFPKERTGKECKKTDCDRHTDYVKWDCWGGNPNLPFCMNCKHSHVSQYKKKEKNT